MNLEVSAAIRSLVVRAAAAVLAIGAGVYVFHDRAVAAPAATTVPPAHERETAPQKTTYAIARKTGRPYRCTYSWSSFMGSHNDFTAEILGDDFVTVPLAWKPQLDSKGMPTEFPPAAFLMNFARKGSLGYSWPCNPKDPPTPGVEGCRFDLARFKAETGVVFGDGLFFAPPKDDASCERIDAATRTIPPLTFGDQSQMFIDGYREEQGKTAAAVEGFDFTVYLPPTLPPGWSIRDPFGAGEGFAYRRYAENPHSKDEVYLEYKSAAHEEILAYQRKAPATFNPPNDCAGVLSRNDEPRRQGCRFLFSTKREHAVYVQDLSPNHEAARHVYSAVIDGTVVSVGAFDPIANVELETFFDSLRPVTGREFAKRVQLNG